MYFWPNEMKATKEEIQTIFKLRCRTTDLKTNMKGLYDTYDCPLGDGPDDSQAHILECPIIEKESKIKMEAPNYEQIYENDPIKLVMIARKFKINMEIRESIMKKRT